MKEFLNIRPVIKTDTESRFSSSFDSALAGIDDSARNESKTQNLTRYASNYESPSNSVSSSQSLSSENISTKNEQQEVVDDNNEVIFLSRNDTGIKLICLRFM